MDEVPASRAARLVADLRQLLTLKQHYYPEGGWGWVVLVAAVFVQILSHGLLASAGLFYIEILRKFGTDVAEPTGSGWMCKDLQFTIKSHILPQITTHTHCGRFSQMD